MAVPDPGPALEWLGGKIAIAVRMETGLSVEDSAVWDVALWDVAVWSSEDLAWEDITPFVQDVTYQRGAERWDSRFTAGSATLELDNTTGLFTPEGDGAHPWSLPFRPGRRVEISCIPDETTGIRVALFTGRIEEGIDQFGAAGGDLVSRVDLSDALGELGMNNPPALDTATGVQGTDDRIHAALDYGGLPMDLRDVQTGVHTMETSFLAQSTLEECQRAADAEGGAFYAGGDGIFYFKARDWLTTDPRSTTVQGYLGYEEIQDPLVPHAHILDVDAPRSLGRVRNDVQYARDGGTLQHVEDPDSIQIHGRRSYSRTDLNNNTDAEVLFLAERALEAYKSDRLRIDAVSIAANADPDNDDLNRLFYGVEMGDLLELEIRTLHGWRITGHRTHVIGVSGHITPNDWTVSYTVDDSLIPEAA